MDVLLPWSAEVWRKSGQEDDKDVWGTVRTGRGQDGEGCQAGRLEAEGKMGRGLWGAKMGKYRALGRRRRAGEVGGLALVGRGLQDPGGWGTGRSLG